MCIQIWGVFVCGCGCVLNTYTRILYQKLQVCTADCRYGVALVSRINEMIGLFCRISSLLYGSFAKETYNLIDLTNRSHPIGWHS